MPIRTILDAARASALAGALAACLVATAAAEPVDLGDLTLAPDATTFDLDNGLQVIVIPDRRAPIVTHMLWYKVGSADEPPGKSGIAHYLEHLMFKGTEANPAGEFSSTIARLGGRENAFTSNDYTAYFQQVAKEHLGTMMAFEADRMTGLVLSPEVALPEREVVLEERAQRVSTRPAAELSEAVDAALYVNHPYGIPVIGWQDEIEALTHEDAIAFYRDHYRPGNAVLVIAGDVTEAEIRALVAETYAKVEDDMGRVPRERPQVQRLRADRLVELRDPRVSQSQTQIAFVTPSYTTAEGEREAEALDLLAEILGGNNTSRLYTKLVREEGLATSAGAYYQSGAVDDSRFILYATPADGVALETLETRMRQIVEDLIEQGVSEAEMKRGRTNLLASAVFAQDSQSTLARIFGASLTTGGTVEDVQTWPRAVGAVTADDVREAARTHLSGVGSVTGRLIAAAAVPTADAAPAAQPAEAAVAPPVAAE